MIFGFLSYHTDCPPFPELFLLFRFPSEAFVFIFPADRCSRLDKSPLAKSSPGDRPFNSSIVAAMAARAALLRTKSVLSARPSRGRGAAVVEEFENEDKDPSMLFPVLCRLESPGC